MPIAVHTDEANEQHYEVRRPHLGRRWRAQGLGSRVSSANQRALPVVWPTGRCPPSTTCFAWASTSSTRAACTRRAATRSARQRPTCSVRHSGLPGAASRSAHCAHEGGRRACASHGALVGAALTCERADLKDGREILELGCGWGSFSLYAAAQFPKSKVCTCWRHGGSRDVARGRHTDARACGRDRRAFAICARAAGRR